MCLGIAVTVACVGLGVWVAPRPKQSEAEPSTKAAQPKTTAKHFNGTVHFDLLAKLLADDRRASTDDWLPDLADLRSALRHSPPLLGKPAPGFTLSDQGGEFSTLCEHLDHGPFVLVSHLGYSCPACVHDLFELNADLARFRSLSTQIVAVSGDASENT